MATTGARRRATAVSGGERVRLAPGPVEREHELSSEPIPEGMASDQLLQLGDQAVVPTECEVGIDPVLQGRGLRLLETRPGVSGERLGAELGEGWAAPELERPPEQLGGRFRVAGGQSLAPIPDEGCRRRSSSSA
jgi:hypothetical protein